jgi:hypothetical protein
MRGHSAPKRQLGVEKARFDADPASWCREKTDLSFHLEPPFAKRLPSP